MKKEERKIEKAKPKVKEQPPSPPKELTKEDLLRIRDEEKKADYESAVDLFDVVETSNRPTKKTFVIDGTKPLSEFNPSSKEDFEKMASYISSHISKFQVCVVIANYVSFF